MSPEFAYFLKVNVALILFYAFYRLFFDKDTFFQLRRTLLLVFFGLAFLYPLLNFQQWIMDKEPIVEMVYLYSMMLPETVVGVEETAAFDWQAFILSGCSVVYGVGVALLLVRFLIQLGSIVWLGMKSKRAVIHGTNVCLLDKPSGPFSFFRLVFIYPASHSDKELGEILVHERTHVRQWHSADVIVSELISAVCWINPFVWLMKREVRYNLEYLADNTVVNSGYDSKSYQYHLLGLAHHNNQAAANIYNNFNVLHLKNRISMMNKKRSRNIGRTKYLIFLPLLAALMLLSNIEAIARVTKDLTSSAKPGEVVKVMGIVSDTNGKPIIGAAVVIKGSTTGTLSDLDGNYTIETSDNATLLVSFPGYNVKELPLTKGEDYYDVILEPEKVQTNQDKQKPLTVVDEMPKFPGGEGELLKFISNSIKYPVIAKENGIQGRVICVFVVNSDGSITDAEILRSVDPSLDQEALRVIGTMPKWTPGKNKGEAVAVKYTIPVTFRLDKANPSTSGKTTEVPLSEIFDSSDPDNPVYRVVEEMPKYPGGEEALLKFIASNVKYPADAKRDSIQGRVIAVFTVNADGSISDTEVIRSISPSIDQEAIRVISIMPKWEPGKNKGEAVRVKYTVPITFRMQ